MEIERNLVLIRTPFQAYVFNMVSKKLALKNYDLAYFTQNDSEEDRYYYSILSEKAQIRRYIYVFPEKKEFLNIMRFFIRVKSMKLPFPEYRRVILSSIEFPIFNFILAKTSKAEIITFDDGVANIYSSSRYRSDRLGFREKLYLSFLGGIRPEKVKKIISKHFTIYSGHENIVPQNRLFLLDKFFKYSANFENESIVFFIGTPFDRFYSAHQVKKLVSLVKKFRPDFYVKHPRERGMILSGVAELEKNGLIAEEAIINASRGRNIKLVGPASTVMLNLADCAIEKTIIAPKNLPHKNLLKILSEKGCEIIEV